MNISNIKTLPLSERTSKSNINKIMINPDNPNPNFLKLQIPSNLKLIKQLALKIKQARVNNKPVILTFGAHLIKNGLSLTLIKLIVQNLITHLATNGAGSIHDWELAFQGKTEEDVRHYVQQGQFGLWEETGKYLNQALIQGANQNFSYGESVGKLIQEEELINNIDNQIKDKSSSSIGEGSQAEQSPPNSLSINNSGGVDKIKIHHPYKHLSIFATAYQHNIPITVHPCLGQDIIHIHPLADFQAIGKTAQIDFNKFINSIQNLEGGIYISISSAIMSPMIFEKALSVARNIAHQKGEQIKDFMIVVNDIQDSGDWDWNSNQDPPKTSPAYYLRFCKTFHRMGAREMHYIQEDNRGFLVNLYRELKRT